MVKTEPSMEHKLSLEALNSERSPGAAGDRTTIDRVVRECVEFENRRFLCNRERGGYSFETLTFLGCSMEMLRSSLAKWAERNNGGDEGSWRPSLFFSGGAKETDGARFVFTF